MTTHLLNSLGKTAGRLHLYCACCFLYGLALTRLERVAPDDSHVVYARGLLTDIEEERT